MGQESHQRKIPYAEGLISALAVGGFLIILGFVFALDPNTWNSIITFFSNIKAVMYQLPNTGSTIYIPAPADPAAHATFYQAVMNFCLGIGVLQIVILSLRLYVKSAIRRISETVGNLIFWFGAAFDTSVFLMAGTLNGWFQFWAVLLLIVGISLIARGFVYFASRKT